MAPVCPECKEKIKGNESYCPFCQHYLGDKSAQEIYRGSGRMNQYAGCLYCGMCIVTIILISLLGGFFWW